MEFYLDREKWYAIAHGFSRDFYEEIATSICSSSDRIRNELIRGKSYLAGQVD